MTEDGETWRPIIDGSDYEVSNLGRVKSLRRGILLKPNRRRDGYTEVHVKRRHRLIHRMVLESFVGVAGPSHEAGHLNGTRDDNRLLNLSWVTAKKNAEQRAGHGRTCRGSRHPRARLTDAKVIDILEMRSGGSGYRTIAAAFGVPESAIRAILRGRNWAHVTAGRLPVLIAPRRKRRR